MQTIQCSQNASSKARLCGDHVASSSSFLSSISQSLVVIEQTQLPSADYASWKWWVPEGIHSSDIWDIPLAITNVNSLPTEMSNCRWILLFKPNFHHVYSIILSNLPLDLLSHLSVVPGYVFIHAPLSLDSLLLHHALTPILPVCLSATRFCLVHTVLHFFSMRA